MQTTTLSPVQIRALLFIYAGARIPDDDLLDAMARVNELEELGLVRYADGPQPQWVTTPMANEYVEHLTATPIEPMARQPLPGYIRTRARALTFLEGDCVLEQIRHMEGRLARLAHALLSEEEYNQTRLVLSLVEHLGDVLGGITEWELYSVRQDGQGGYRLVDEASEAEEHD